MSSISAENVLTSLLEEPKLEEKRFMHLQSLVKVPWLAVPVSEWPPASKWLAEQLPNGDPSFTSNNIRIFYNKNHLTVSFQENHRFKVNIETEIKDGATKEQCFGKGKIITSSKALEIARNNYVVKKYEDIQNIFLTSKTKEWLETGWSLTESGKIFEVSYQEMVCLKIGVDFVSIRFNDRYAGRFYTPHNVRLHLFKGACKTFDEVLKLGRNEHPEVTSEPKLNDNAFSCGKHCPTIRFVDDEKASCENKTGRARCPYQINIPYTKITSKKGVTYKKWTVLWSAPMCSGKSHSIREVLKNNPNWKVLVISVRIALTNSFVEDFEKDGVQGFVNYQEKKGLLRDNRLIVQIDSLKRVKNFQKFDLLILDESQSLTAHFAAETFENAAQVFETFRRCISIIPRVIAMDADMEKYGIDRTRWLIEGICKRPPTIIRSKALNDYRRYVRVPSQNDLIFRICALIESGKRVVIVSNNKIFPKEVHHILSKKFNKKRGLAIYNEAGHTWNDCVRGRMIRKNNPEDFEDLSWFAYSPIVSPGVSFDYKEFDVVCAAASPSEHACGVRFFAQLCNRVRDIKLGVVFYHIPPKSPYNFKSSRWKDIREEYNKMGSLQKDFVTNFSRVIDQQQGMAEDEEDDMDEDLVRCAPIQMATKAFNILWCKIELEARKSITHFEREFKEAKELDGGKFYYLTPSESDMQHIEDIKTSKRNSKRELKEMELNNILQAGDISHEKWELLKEKRNKTSKESFEVKKFEFCFYNGIDSNDKKLKDHLNNLGAYNAYDEDLFINLLLPPKALEDYDLGKLGKKVNKNGERITFSKINTKLSSVKTSYIIDILNVLGIQNILEEKHFDSKSTNVDLSKVREIIKTVKADPDTSRRFGVGSLSDGLDDKKCWTFLCTAFNAIAKDMGVGVRMSGVRGKRKWSLSHKFRHKWVINESFYNKLEYVLKKLKCKDRFWWGEYVEERVIQNVKKLLQHKGEAVREGAMNSIHSNNCLLTLPYDDERKTGENNQQISDAMDVDSTLTDAKKLTRKICGITVPRSFGKNIPVPIRGCTWEANAKYPVPTIKEGEELDVVIIPSKYATEDCWSEVSNLSSHDDTKPIDLDFSKPKWTNGSHPYLKYRGNAIKRQKIWLQDCNDKIRIYNYTGFQYNVANATVALDQTNLEATKKLVKEMEDECDGNHWIITKYENGKDNIGAHFDKTGDWEDNSYFQVVKFGTPRRFQIFLRDKIIKKVQAKNRKGQLKHNKNGFPIMKEEVIAKPTLVFDKILPPGTMIKLSMSANLRTRHAVPEMENVGRSGSIVSRMIKTTLTVRELKKKQKKKIVMPNTMDIDNNNNNVPSPLKRDRSARTPKTIKKEAKKSDDTQ